MTRKTLAGDCAALLVTTLAVIGGLALVTHDDTAAAKPAPVTIAVYGPGDLGAGNDPKDYGYSPWEVAPDPGPMGYGVSR
ncbi:hypothetical protein ACFPA8_07745 [Streptomyces ovatisporus]|uniref:Secreted protein n=1 Tax=Streptomyces ovatisporus TaxID=1128682 RepID=A0ABV9A5Z3_9ACTN